MHYLLVHREPLWLLTVLFGAKAVATALTFAGGGTGGIFFPMAAMGIILGTAFSHFVQWPTGSLYPLIGLAAFLGAGYRAPVAAVAFIAESSGNPWALLPGMVAAVASFTVMGEGGVSDEQRDL
jgi:CIC family chloride channel protein